MASLYWLAPQLHGSNDYFGKKSSGNDKKFLAIPKTIRLKNFEGSTQYFCDQQKHHQVKIFDDC